MKKTLCILFAVLLVATTAIALVACQTEKVDYVAQTTLKLNSSTRKMSVVVKKGGYVDGDTTHFVASEAEKHNFKEGILKARYLAVDTPESTGDIEPYGKAAANFTNGKLASVDPQDADGIILESNDSVWNPDSTGDRYLVWVWYRVNSSSPYRLLNLEILQEGLALRKSLNNTLIYFKACDKAVTQAQALKLNIYSGKQDSLYHYGAAKEVTLKQLRIHIEDYKLTKVAFEGVVAYHDFDQRGIYVVERDAEDDITYGIFVYYGYGIQSGTENFAEGNRIRFVGTVSLYEASGQYQVSGITFDPFFERDDGYRVISTDNEIPYNEADLATYQGKVSVIVNDDEAAQQFDYAALTMQAPVKIDNLTVTDIYTTKGDKNSAGAMTLTCTSGGKTFTVRTEVLHQDDDAKKPLMVEADYMDKTINVLGFGDCYEGAYQLKAVLTKYIEVL